MNKGLDMEVVKFGVVIAINLITVTGAYFQLKSDVEKALEIALKNETKVTAVQRHNQKQDLETVRFRTEMKSRVTNIENLTKEIHTAIVGD